MKKSLQELAQIMGQSKRGGTNNRIVYRVAGGGAFTPQEVKTAFGDEKFVNLLCNIGGSSAMRVLHFWGACVVKDFIFIKISAEKIGKNAYLHFLFKTDDLFKKVGTTGGKFDLLKDCQELVLGYYDNDTDAFIKYQEILQKNEKKGVK